MIVHLTSEVTPFYKRGGLGDVVGALPRFLNRQSQNVVISFFYEGRMNFESEDHKSFKIDIQNIQYEFIYYPATVDGVVYYFLNMSDNLIFSDMESGDAGSMGKPDIDGEKPYKNNSSFIIYLYFAKAALTLIDILGLNPRYLFCHDWHVCGCFAFPGMIEKMKCENDFDTILLIHNYEHQGEVLPDRFYLVDNGICNEFDSLFDEFGTASFLALGLKNADYVATVSATYANELMQGIAPHAGLKFLRTIKKGKIYALPNGIDDQLWSPVSSPFLEHKYNSFSAIKRKQDARSRFLDTNNLLETGAPVVLMMARLTEQKGINIFMDLWNTEEAAIGNIESLLDVGITLVICGRPAGGLSGNIHKRLMRAMELFPGRLCYLPEYSDQLAHSLLAASDVILCPSLYEPCGLVHLYAMAFGTIPVVRPVGGLFDTVIPFPDNLEKSTGFFIPEFNHASLVTTLKHVCDLFHRSKEQWHNMMRRCMGTDYSWNGVMENYVNFFDEIEKTHVSTETIINY